MAHRSNVIQVQRNFDWSQKSGESEQPVVMDPVCGKELERKTARHVLFRDNGTFYFCSKECQQNFQSPTFRAKAAS